MKPSDPESADGPSEHDHAAEQRSETALVHAAQCGDRQAFACLVQTCHSRLLRWLTSLTRDRAIAEELLQDSLFKAFVSLADFRGDARFSTWLARIVRHTFLAWRKMQDRRPDAQLLSDSIDFDGEASGADQALLVDSQTPEATLWQQQLIQCVQSSLEELPADLREAFELREQQGLTYEEIAQHQQVAVGTVRSRIFRARSRVSEKLKQLMEPA